MKCIVGLGNPGNRYRTTRHNAGFLAIEYMIEKFAAEHRRTTDECIWYGTDFADAPLLFAMPQTYMNNSGFAVREVIKEFGLSPADLLIIYDDFQLPYGTIRLRPHGSDGGHNGIASIIEQLETADIPRLRIGVSGISIPTQHTHHSMAEYVLSSFDTDEMELLPAVLGYVQTACASWVLNGLERTMSKYNRDFFTSANAE